MSGNSSDPSTWAPSGESSFNIFNDAVDLIASTTTCAFSYGIAFTLYCICARQLYLQRRHPERRKQSLFLLVYTTILIICGGLYVASSSRVAQLAYVDNRNFPAGPAAYTLFIFSSPDSVLGVVTYFIINWMTDAILIWRVYTLWSVKRYGPTIIIFPCLLYMASFSMSIVIIYESSRPAQSFWSKAAVPFALAYYVLTASLTIISTILMTTRLLRARRQYVSIMGNTTHARQYLSIAAMLIESSALYSIWSIVFVGLYSVNHPIQNVFLGTLAGVQIIALLLIIYRVSQGKAWKSNTEQTFSSMSWVTRRSSGGVKHVPKPLFRQSHEDHDSATQLDISPDSAVAVEAFIMDEHKTRAEV